MSVAAGRIGEEPIVLADWYDRGEHSVEVGGKFAFTMILLILFRPPDRSSMLCEMVF